MSSPVGVTFQSTVGEARGQNKTSPKVKPSLKPTASPQGPAAPARPGFLLSLCPGDKVRRPKPLVQRSSGIWVSFSSLPQENFKSKKKNYTTEEKKKKIITLYSSSTT